MRIQVIVKLINAHPGHDCFIEVFVLEILAIQYHAIAFLDAINHLLLNVGIVAVIAIIDEPYIQSLQALQVSNAPSRTDTRLLGSISGRPNNLQPPSTSMVK